MSSENPTHDEECREIERLCGPAGEQFKPAPPAGVQSVMGADDIQATFDEYGIALKPPHHIDDVVELLASEVQQKQARVAELDNENNDLCGWVDDLKARVDELEKALTVMPKPPGSDIDTVYLRRMQEWWYRVGLPALGGGGVMCYEPKADDEILESHVARARIAALESENAKLREGLKRLALLAEKREQP